MTRKVRHQLFVLLCLGREHIVSPGLHSGISAAFLVSVLSLTVLSIWVSHLYLARDINKQAFVWRRLNQFITLHVPVAVEKIVVPVFSV